MVEFASGVETRSLVVSMAAGAEDRRAAGRRDAARRAGRAADLARAGGERRAAVFRVVVLRLALLRDDADFFVALFFFVPPLLDLEAPRPADFLVLFFLAMQPPSKVLAHTRMTRTVAKNNYILNIPPQPGRERMLLPSRILSPTAALPQLSRRRISRWRVQVQQDQVPGAGLPDLVFLALFNQQQRPRRQLHPPVLDHRLPRP